MVIFEGTCRFRFSVCRVACISKNIKINVLKLGQSFLRLSLRREKNRLAQNMDKMSIFTTFTTNC